MKYFQFLVAITTLSILLLTGCQKDNRIGNEMGAPQIQTENKALAMKSARLSPELKARFESLRSSLPASLKEKIQQNTSIFVKTHPEYREMALRALKAVQPTPCDDNTVLNQWLGDQLSDWNSEVITYALNTGMLVIPSDYAIVYEEGSNKQYFGVNGEFSHAITKTFKDIKRFWNIQTEDIEVVGIHGSVLRDREKLVKMYLLYGFSTKDSEFLADLVVELMKVFSQYRNGDHPIFSFNAFATPSLNIPPIGAIPPKISIGDGILEAYAAIGYGDVAPQAVLAHEFGHHIQFQLGLFGGESSPEATRRTELMADAYAAYYLSHARGASMQWKRVKQFLQVFFNIGDCEFTDNNHHGTPTQRMAAAEWGYRLADNAQKQGHILSAQEFTKLFDAALPKIVQQ